MIAKITPGKLHGTVDIPASKSHTIRALIIATLASGKSRIRSPLDSADTRSCMEVCRALGARIDEVTVDADASGAPTSSAGRTAPATEPAAGDSGDGFHPPPRLTALTVTGIGPSRTPAGSEALATGRNPATHEALTVDVGNSGTTLTIAAGAAALLATPVTFTGDEQIAARPIEPLLAALEDLGALCRRAPRGRSVPFTVTGPLAGGRTEIECPTSQYLSALLIAAPLASGKSDGPASPPPVTEIAVPLLHERPYVEMTLAWLESQGIEYERRGLEWFRIPGRQGYRPFERRIPGDFSSATFMLCAAAVTRSRLLLRGLDMSDSQGDKAVVSMLARLGCPVDLTAEGLLIEGDLIDERGLDPCELDLNATPDALPALAATACYSRGTVRLVNVPQARLKETDRIAVMEEELTKLGVRVHALEDGLEITGSALKAGRVNGHGDHRVVMALALAGLGAEGTTEIETAETASITYPGFFETLRSLQEG
jgi:3-phosphoshikimate 1-carboxyvinyltransferase